MPEAVETTLSALSRISAALKKSRKVNREIADDGAWFFEIEKRGYLRFVIEYDGSTMTVGWYDIRMGLPPDSVQISNDY
jgi:hypothetical protein